MGQTETTSDAVRERVCARDAEAALDVVSARRAGASGKAYGLDMTDEMLDLARRNAAEAGATTSSS